MFTDILTLAGYAGTFVAGGLLGAVVYRNVIVKEPAVLKKLVTIAYDEAQKNAAAAIAVAQQAVVPPAAPAPAPVIPPKAG